MKRQNIGEIKQYGAEAQKSPPDMYRDEQVFVILVYLSIPVYCRNNDIQGYSICNTAH